MTTTTRAEFDARSPPGTASCPVLRELFADGETPVGVYRKLAGGKPGHLPAGVRRAGRHLVALLVRRASTASAC